jgi:hypothetical protein
MASTRTLVRQSRNTKSLPYVASKQPRRAKKGASPSGRDDGGMPASIVADVRRASEARRVIRDDLQRVAQHLDEINARVVHVLADIAGAKLANPACRPADDLARILEQCRYIGGELSLWELTRPAQ